MHVAVEIFFHLLNSKDQKPIVRHPGGNSEKKRVLNENNETEHRPIEMTMRVLNLNVGLRMTEDGIRLSADSVCNDQRATAIGQRIVRTFAFLL